jgi:AraC-like DNA-binding protein
MQYLARWRLQIAAQELLIGSRPLAAIAEQVGYVSEAAFNRAFKREFGMPPAGWRKNRGRRMLLAHPRMRWNSLARRRQLLKTCLATIQQLPIVSYHRRSTCFVQGR